jgi:hypothetical protein
MSPADAVFSHCRFVWLAARTSEPSVDNHFTRQYNPEDSSERNLHRQLKLKITKESKTMKVVLQRIEI